MKVVVSWSGGKDGCFALYKAQKQVNEVVSLLTIMSSSGKSNFHMLPPEIIDSQAQAIGKPIEKLTTAPQTYEQEFKKALFEMKKKGVEGLVTGDIYEVAGHEEGWLERICKEIGLTPIRPLWFEDTKKLLEEFIDLGFNATVVKVNTKKLSTQWLGRQLNRQFYDDITKLPGVDPCGEGGEYHTCITDGPVFKRRIKILRGEQSVEGDFGFFSIKDFEVKSK